MIVALGIKIVFECVYEAFGVYESTAWTIAYNFIDYMTWSAVYMLMTFLIADGYSKIGIIQRHSTFLQLLFSGIGVIYASYAMIELTYLTYDYDIYLIAMNEAQYSLSKLIAVASAVVIYYSMYRHKCKKTDYKFI